MNDSGIRTFTAGEALAAHRLVKLSDANTVSYADAGEQAIGVTRNAVASGAVVAVFMLGGKPGTITVTGNGSISVNALVYPDADGKVSATATGQAIGVALNGAADEAHVEVLPLPVSFLTRESVRTATGAQVLTIASAKHQFIDPQGNVNVDLPAEESSSGLSFVIYNTADAAETITVRNDAAGTVATVAQDEAAVVTCNGTVWRSLVGPNT